MPSSDARGTIRSTSAGKPSVREGQVLCDVGRALQQHPGAGVAFKNGCDGMQQVQRLLAAEPSLDQSGVEVALHAVGQR